MSYQPTDSHDCLTREQAISLLQKVSAEHPDLLNADFQSNLSEPSRLLAEIECRRWLDHSPVCTKIVDLDFNLQYMSAAGIGALGIEAVDDLYGKPYPFDFFPREFNEEMTSNLRLAKKSGQVVSGESQLSDIHGNKIWYHYTLAPVLDGDGKVAYFVVVSINTHDRKCAEVSLLEANLNLTKQMQLAEEFAEHAREANHAKSEFLANMSHEIRTPLTAILGFSDLLASEESVVSCREHYETALRSIQSNADHLLAVINDVLDMSKIEAGVETSNIQSLSLTQPLADVFSLMNPLASKKNISLSITYETALPAVIQSDLVKLRQILLNLVSNAIKFTEHGSVKVAVFYDQPDELLTIRISDSGIGMSSEQRESIASFKAFNQADNSTRRQFGGTGLGLKISNSLAQMLGGSIDIESTPGIGSTFTLNLPANPLEGASLIEPSQLQHLSSLPLTTTQPTSMSIAHKLTGYRVLLVEDGPDNQKLLSMLLQSAGADLHVIENGEAAIEHLQKLDSSSMPHVILMDLQMPVMDGYTATKQLRESGFETPIIALTAHAMEHDRTNSIAAGCNDYLTKPIDKHLLVDTCMRWATQSV